MKRNTTMAVLVLLMLTWGIPAYGANKEMIQLQEQVKLLGNQMTRMQQSFDEKLAALQANAEQTADNVKQISTWAPTRGRDSEATDGRLGHLRRPDLRELKGFAGTACHHAGQELSPNVSQRGRVATKSSSIGRRRQVKIRKSLCGPSSAILLAVLAPGVRIFGHRCTCRAGTERKYRRCRSAGRGSSAFHIEDGHFSFLSEVQG